MPFLMVTQKCNRGCDFCFAQDNMSKPGSANPDISLENFEKALAWFEKDSPSEKSLALVGGEPTIHPKLPQLLDQAFERGYKLTIYTNMVFSKSVQNLLSEYSSEQITLVFNLNSAPMALKGFLQNNLEVLSEKVELSLIIEKDLEKVFHLFDSSIELIKNLGLKKRIRLKLAHPIHGGGNQYLEVSEYASMTKKLNDWLSRCTEAGIIVELGCGFVKCLFTDTELKRWTQAGHKMFFACTPHLDINKNLTGAYCYALSPLPQEAIDKYKNPEEMAEFFRKKYRAVQGNIGVYTDCTNCPDLKSGACTGGCLSHTLNPKFNPPSRYS